MSCCWKKYQIGLNLLLKIVPNICCLSEATKNVNGNTSVWRNSLHKLGREIRTENYVFSVICWQKCRISPPEEDRQELCRSGRYRRTAQWTHQSIYLESVTGWWQSVNAAPSSKSLTHTNRNCAPHPSFLTLSLHRPALLSSAIFNSTYGTQCSMRASIL